MRTKVEIDHMALQKRSVILRGVSTYGIRGKGLLRVNNTLKARKDSVGEGAQF